MPGEWMHYFNYVCIQFLVNWTIISWCHIYIYNNLEANLYSSWDLFLQHIIEMCKFWVKVSDLKKHPSLWYQVTIFPDQSTNSKSETMDGFELSMPPDETQMHREISVDLLEFPVWSVSKIAGSGDIYNFWKWGWHWQPEKLFGINEYPCDFSSSSPSCGSFEPSASSAMNECLHELMNDWMNEWRKEGMNKRQKYTKMRTYVNHSMYIYPGHPPPLK